MYPGQMFNKPALNSNDLLSSSSSSAGSENKLENDDFTIQATKCVCEILRDVTSVAQCFQNVVAREMFYNSQLRKYIKDQFRSRCVVCIYIYIGLSGLYVYLINIITYYNPNNPNNLH